MTEELKSSPLALALSKAQGQMKGALKDAENPFFKSSYADLASVWEACRKPLSDNELAVTQIIDMIDGNMILRTFLLHSGGEKLESIMPIQLSDKSTAQQIGSIITYMRRYSLSAIVGVAPEEDDGNKASETHVKVPPKSNAAKFADSKPGETDLLKASVTEFVKKIEMAETANELSRIIAGHANIIKKVEEILPEEWGKRVNDKIAQCREAFELSGDE